MKTFSLISLLFPVVVTAQLLNYSPNRKLEKTVAKTYYNTEFIFLKNISDQAFTIEFEVLENTFDDGWSATFCTSAQCFNTIPKLGTLGNVNPGGEAYFSFNFAANDKLGDGQVRVLLQSPERPELQDTITFKYTVTEDGSVEAGPWADISYKQGILTIFLQNPAIETKFQVASLDGRIVFQGILEQITSLPLREHPKGVYLVVIRDENDRMISEKIARI